MRKPDYPLTRNPRLLDQQGELEEMFIRTSGNIARRVCSLQTDRDDCAWMFKAKQLLKSAEYLYP